MKYPKVIVIILNWNGKEDTIECLDSLKHITYPNYEILLVDNGSVDGSVECFRKLYPEIEIIENEENLGFAEGNNVALKEVVAKGSDYCLLLNNDTIVDSNFLFELVNVAENDKKIGIVGPTIFHYKNREKIQSAGGKIYWKRGTAPHYTDRDNRKEIISRTRDVDYIMGCALLAKTKLVGDIGYLKKEYFAYWEEVDWCVRAHKAGYRIVHVPSSKIWHKGGATAKKTSGFFEYQMARNMFWFMKEHTTKKEYILFLIYFFGFKFWFSSASLILYHKNVKGYNSFLKGIYQGIKTFH
jgi:hypothetical protein